MGINLYNREGYVDPTAYKALSNILRDEKKKMGGRKECFALKDRSCTALNIRKCEDCSFYKTIEHAKKEREKALKHIKLLEKDMREYILSKYYSVKGSI